ncbi:MAG: hypothetical protein AB8G05_14405 [Oligoflexales bacterium]
MTSQEQSYNKYIHQYSEPETILGKWIVDLTHEEGAFDRLLVVPLCSEREAFPFMMQSVVEAVSKHSLNILLILVVNHRKDSPDWMQENNRVFLEEWGRKLEEKKFHPSTGAFFGKYKSLQILFVDRATIGREFPEKQGVGLARKIGCDIAFFLWFANKSIAPFAFTSDGDAVLPQDYFVGFDWKVLVDEHVSAVTFPFEHFELASMNKNEIRAMHAYDFYLRYYQQGLENSGSPYAYQNIGSTICFSLSFYGKVRGFPKKQAGEDFYFLNKLRKMGPIREKKGNTIQLQGRPSIRVPFGTGKSIINIAGTLAKGEEYLIYHPHVFKILKILLEEVDHFCEFKNYHRFLVACEKRFLLNKLYYCEKNFFNINDLNEIMVNLGLKDFLQNKINQVMSQNVYQFMVWFDSFKTLKFVHELRDKFFPSIAILSAHLSTSDWKVIHAKKGISINGNRINSLHH